MSGERLDLVIFGATGFTGRHTVKEAARLARDKNFSWGVAGRRKEALESVLKEYAPESENIRVIIADLKDEESLKKMTEQTKVIVNCSGPYSIYGEPVIKACIATKTHHVDISGEPYFIERMELEYHSAAQEAGVYIVSACGFDSIPCDLGIIFTQNNFEGEINSIESYLKVWSTVNVGGAILHYGTYESVVQEASHESELQELRTKLHPQRLPELKPKLKNRGFVHRNSISEGWSTVFPGGDVSVALRTQRFLFDKYKQRPVQIQTYITFNSFFHIMLLAIFGGLFSVLVKFQSGRNLLLKHPKFFSRGLSSHEGPKPERMENTHFSITFFAKGWTEKLGQPTEEHKGAPNKEMVTKVTGVNLGYGAAVTTLLMSAIMILKESDKMPENGGVLPPGAAFGKTSIIDELNKNGVKFEVVSSVEK